MICYFLDSDPKSIPIFNKKIEKIKIGENGFEGVLGLNSGFREEEIRSLVEFGRDSKSRFLGVFGEYEVKQIALPGGNFI